MSQVFHEIEKKIISVLKTESKLTPEKLEKLTQHIAHDLQAVYPNGFPHAQDIARIGQFAWREGKVHPAEQALPVYLRDNVR